MEKVENKHILTIAIISLLTSLGIGGGVVLNDTSLDNYFICDVNYNIGEFQRLSSTLYTAYPNLYDNKGYVRCKNNSIKGKWYDLKEFAELNNINIEDLIEINDTEDEIEDKPIVVIPNSTFGIKYECNQFECIKIEG